MSELTAILHRVNRGEAGAYEELVPLVYDELRRRARLCLLGQRNGHTLGPTALVHEAFLKLARAGGNGGTEWQTARHFYHAAAEVMRQVLVSYARRRSAEKRGGDVGRVPLEVVEPQAAGPVPAGGEPDYESLDAALSDLRAMDERRYHVVMLRYFAGLTDAQVAVTLGVSEKTVERDWATAKAFLRGRMAELRGE